MADRRDEARRKDADDVPDGDGAGSGRGRRQRAAYFAYIPDIEEEIIIRGGAFPSASPVNAPGQPFTIEAMIPVEAAELFGAASAPGYRQCCRGRTTLST